jgi:hypothetical protein
LMHQEWECVGLKVSEPMVRGLMMVENE